MIQLNFDLNDSTNFNSKKRRKPSNHRSASSSSATSSNNNNNNKRMKTNETTATTTPQVIQSSSSLSALDSIMGEIEREQDVAYTALHGSQAALASTQDAKFYATDALSLAAMESSCFMLRVDHRDERYRKANAAAIAADRSVYRRPSNIQHTAQAISVEKMRQRWYWKLQKGYDDCIANAFGMGPPVDNPDVSSVSSSSSDDEDADNEDRKEKKPKKKKKKTKKKDIAVVSKLQSGSFSRWQFARMSAHPGNPDPLIPDVEVDEMDPGLLNELTQAGLSEASAREVCQQLNILARSCLQAVHNYVAPTSRKKQHVHVSKIGGDNKRDVSSELQGQYELKLGKIVQRINALHYAKLWTMYCLHHASNNGDTTSKQPSKHTFHQDVLLLLTRYETLQGFHHEGAGYQAACNEELFSLLHHKLSVQMECFASPLNSYFPTFCSAFPDTDAVFGSQGSFFSFFPKQGSFQVNPPFVAGLIEDMHHHIELLLQQATGPMSFVVIIPEWQETKGWQQLQQSGYNRKTVHISQQDHGYCEGAQHLRASRYRIASFHTSVFFLQNDMGYTAYRPRKSIVKAMRVAFASKHKQNNHANDDPCRVFVGGIPPEVNAAEISTHFSTCGSIELVDFPRKAETKKFKFCFVTFQETEAAQRALSMPLQLANGKSIGSISLSMQKKR